MAKSIEVVLTSYHTEPTAKACTRILVSRDNLLYLTGSLDGGRKCTVEKVDDDGSAPVRREASLWPSPDPLRRNLARMSKAFREACGFGSAEKCRITFATEDGLDVVSDATEVVVEELTTREGPEPVVSAPEQISPWVEHIEEHLDAAEVVFPGMVLGDVKRRRTRRDFAVKTVDGQTNNLARFCVDQTKVRFASHSLPVRLATGSVSTTDSTAMVMATPQGLQVDPIDGLEMPMKLLNKYLLFFHPASPRVPGESCAVVLEGDKGSGKTTILNRLAATDWGRVFHIMPGEKLLVIQEIFTKAREQQPSMILIDNIDELLSKERMNRATVIDVLGSLLDQLAEAVVATPQVLVVATCKNYLRDIPENLQQSSRLVNSVTIPFPDTQTREVILRSFGMRLPPVGGDALIHELSLKTHSFNGHEIRNLFNKAVGMFRCRILDADDQDMYLKMQDFNLALEMMAPCARMEGTIVKPLPVFWHQIHGQAALVDALQTAVVMTNDPERFSGYVKRVPRGYLLYGPPGCSKTMAAQALATESGLNYFSVKGGELLNQYVGESERGIRELFRRAKRASPAVIFLDEIDAIAGRRSDVGDMNASSARGPQMVSALLSELDGFEPLSKVFVVAATNRPETLDPALLRPGRLECHYYVPPPNEQARRAILQSWAQGMCVSPDFDFDHIARLSDKFSGAELIGICQKVGLECAQKKRNEQQPQPGPHEPIPMTTEMVADQIGKTEHMITKETIEFFNSWSVSY